jgi:hypothetical protein
LVDFFYKKSTNEMGEVLAEKKIVWATFLWSLGDFFTKTFGHPDFRLKCGHFHAKYFVQETGL